MTKHKKWCHSDLSFASYDRSAINSIIAACSKDDGVRKPSHYQVFDGVESIEIIARSMTVSEFRGFCMGNVLKYRLRAGKKSELATMEKDLNKAAFYQELFDLHKGKCYATK
ncbi:nucleotide kinase [Escherichia phage pO91]|uniref:Nucleotide kinase n=1 Tax=Escherichia phage pO91 TaxID=3072194 RepID=A0AA51MZR4_9CAUD|nr:nucleotide kinase [Escherichia phage pO91]